MQYVVSLQLFDIDEEGIYIRDVGKTVESSSPLSRPALVCDPDFVDSEDPYVVVSNPVCNGIGCSDLSFSLFEPFALASRSASSPVLDICAFSTSFSSAGKCIAALYPNCCMVYSRPCGRETQGKWDDTQYEFV